MVSVAEEVKVTPFEQYCSFLEERNEVYIRKSRGDPWPWTADPILQTYRFTEVYRERDRTSRHYQHTVRNRYGEDPLVLPATVLYRWFNRIETCDALFNQPDFGNKSVFEYYIDDPKLDTLLYAINQISPPHVTGAFIINGKQGYQKGEGVMRYFHDWCQKDWRKAWESWQIDPPSLEEMYEWLRLDGHGLGSFMAAQLIADLKYLPFMQNVDDWWVWASPGPGSMRGLNAVLGRPMGSPWKEADWLKEIQRLREMENEALAPKGLGPFHAQDTQNHCCEFSKYTKVKTGLGRPRQVYRYGG